MSYSKINNEFIEQVLEKARTHIESDLYEVENYVHKIGFVFKDQGLSPDHLELLKKESKKAAEYSRRLTAGLESLPYLINTLPDAEALPEPEPVKPSAQERSLNIEFIAAGQDSHAMVKNLKSDAEVIDNKKEEKSCHGECGCVKTDRVSNTWNPNPSTTSEPEKQNNENQPDRQAQTPETNKFSRRSLFAFPVFMAASVIVGVAAGSYLGYKQQPEKFSPPPALYEPPHQTAAPAAPVAQQTPSVPAKMIPVDPRLDIVMGHSADKARQFVVFSDPFCPFCKKLEPMLENLSKKGFEIHVFPTPIHSQSRPFLAEMACLEGADAKRHAWVESIGAGKMIGPSGCKTVDESEINDHALMFFSQFGFNATPTIVSPDGRIHVGAFDTESELTDFIENSGK